MKKKFDFSSIPYKLFVEEHIGINDVGKYPEYEQQLQDVSERFLHSIFFTPMESSELKAELVRTLSKFKPQTVSPYLKNYYL
jgi:hypothetical protein